jgi:hypothetical protein
LIEQLAANAKKKLIVFCARKHMCDDIAGKLWSKGVKADSIHGDRDQSTRTRILQNFRQSQIQVPHRTDRSHARGSPCFCSAAQKGAAATIGRTVVWSDCSTHNRTEPGRCSSRRT